MNSSNLTTRIRNLTMRLPGMLLGATLLGQAALAGEYWISPSANTANLGTLAQPFDGSTAWKFDSTLGALPSRSVIHIMPGTYQTEGDFGPLHLKSNDKVIGSGEDVTTLQLVPDAHDNAFVMADYGPLGLMDTNITVEDLTLDGNYQGGAKTLHGICLTGPNMTIRGVKVVNCAFFDPNANSECWEIAIAGQNALIEHCLIENFYGTTINDFVDAFTISADGYGDNGSGIIRDNTAIFTNNPASIGINGSWNNGILIEGNTIIGANVCVYNDTGDNTNITIVNNNFQNTRSALYFGNGNNVRQNYIVANNIITLGTNSRPVNWATAINLGNGCTNWNVTGNIVGWYCQPPTKINGYFLVCANNEQGIVVANNRVDSSLGNYLVTNGFAAYGNYGSSGNWLTNLNQSSSLP